MRAVPAFRQYGLGFIYGTTWDPNKAQYGILPEISGTLYTSLLALVIGSAFGVAAAIFLSEGYLGEFVSRFLREPIFMFIRFGASFLNVSNFC